jgi:branched-subunit amino acid transport protein AzlD
MFLIMGCRSTDKTPISAATLMGFLFTLNQLLSFHKRTTILSINGRDTFYLQLIIQN